MNEAKNVLKGNYQKEVLKKEPEKNLTEQFEAEALKRLGGSICFVSKKNFIYGMEEDKKE